MPSSGFSIIAEEGQAESLARQVSLFRTVYEVAVPWIRDSDATGALDWLVEAMLATRSATTKFRNQVCEARASGVTAEYPLAVIGEEFRREARARLAAHLITGFGVGVAVAASLIGLAVPPVESAAIGVGATAATALASAVQGRTADHKRQWVVAQETLRKNVGRRIPSATVDGSD